jgi:hypothetical protein
MQIKQGGMRIIYRLRLQANQIAFVQRYPSVGALYQPIEMADDLMHGMDNGLCEVAVTNQNDWIRLSKLRSNCNKISVPGVLFTQSNAFAVAADIQAPLSWAMTKLINKGEYARLEAQAMRQHIDTLPDACVEALLVDEAETDDEWFSKKNAFVLSTVCVSLITITFAILVFCGSKSWQLYQLRRERAICTESAGLSRRDGHWELEKLVEGSSICTRLFACCDQKEKARVKSEREQMRVLEASTDTKDVELVSTMLKMRHLTMARMQAYIKPGGKLQSCITIACGNAVFVMCCADLLLPHDWADAPLTIADVPMLIQLLACRRSPLTAQSPTLE